MVHTHARAEKDGHLLAQMHRAHFTGISQTTTFCFPGAHQQQQMARVRATWARCLDPPVRRLRLATGAAALAEVHQPQPYEAVQCDQCPQTLEQQGLCL